MREMGLHNIMQSLNHVISYYYHISQYFMNPGHVSSSVKYYDQISTQVLPVGQHIDIIGAFIIVMGWIAQEITYTTYRSAELAEYSVIWSLKYISSYSFCDKIIVHYK